MRIDIDHKEAKDIIESLKKNDQNFLADRFEKQLKREKGIYKQAPMSDARLYHSDLKFGWGQEKCKRS